MGGRRFGGKGVTEVVLGERRSGATGVHRPTSCTQSFSGIIMTHFAMNVWKILEDSFITLLYIWIVTCCLDLMMTVALCFAPAVRYDTNCIMVLLGTTIYMYQSAIKAKPHSSL